MLYAPLVMPEVITGLSLLLLFVALDADRGFWTVTIAHTTLTMCFVTVVVQSRLGSLDRSLEEAAMDLGCAAARLPAVTLPLIIPAIAAGWMLAFTLSLDDLVIASFTTGPGAATLPIRIYSEVRLGVKPEINAICTMVIAASTASRPASVTIAIRPSVGWDGDHHAGAIFAPFFPSGFVFVVPQIGIGNDKARFGRRYRHMRLRYFDSSTASRCACRSSMREEPIA
jgi:hypothetical protein